MELLPAIAKASRIAGTIRETRLGAALASAVVVAVFSSVPVYFALNYSRDHERRFYGEAERHMVSRMVHAQALLDRANTIPGIVALAMAQADTPARFQSTTRNLLAMSGIVTSVNIASTRGPATVVHRDRREQGNLAPMAFPPPGTLVADNRLFIGFGEGSLLIRESLLEADARGGQRFWGYLTAEASFADLANELQLPELVKDGFGVDLRIEWQSRSPATVVFGGGDATRGSARSIALPGGALLTLAVAPPEVSFFGSHKAAAGGLLVADVLLFLLTFHLLRRPQLLEREIAARTREIVAEKVALKKEIAARIKAESYLERSHALLDSIFEHIPGMIVLKRVSDMRIARINASGERMLNRRRDLLTGRSNEEIYAPNLADFLAQGDVQALAEPGLIKMPVRRVDMPAAAPRWIGFSKTALRDRNGVPEYILEFGEDLTEREDLDRRLQEQIHFLAQLIEAFPGPVFSKDVAGRYLAVNAPFEEFIGRPRDELVGKTVFDIAPEHLALEYQRADHALIEAGGKQIYESQVKVADGSISEIMFHKAVFNDANGCKAGIVGIALDISERKRAERRVASLNRVLTVLSEINHLIIYTRDRDRLLDEARRILQQRGEFTAVWIRVEQDGGSRILAEEPIRGYAERIYGEIENPARRCFPERRLHCEAIDCCNTELAAELAERGLKSLMHLPLRSGETVWGDLGILGVAGQSFSAEEQALLEELAGNLSFALDALRQEQRRREAEGKLELAARVFENNSEGIIVTDDVNRIVMVNKAFTTVTGYAAEEVIGKTPALLNSDRHDAEFFREMWRVLQRQGEWRGEVISRRKNGEEFPEWLAISQVRNEAGQVSHYVAVFSDLTARRQIEARVDFLAHYDTLTALPNREHFAQRLAQTVAEAREQSSRAAVVLFDLDRFKLINETVGNVGADQLLVEISSRLLAEAKSKLDVARLGGDQFAAIVPGLESGAQAVQFVARLQDALAKPFLHFRAEGIHVSASIGVALFPEDGCDAETLIRNADSAMYQAIEDGGNTYRLFRQEMSEHAAERVKLESLLHHALERGELSLHFQPFVSVADGRVVGAEALLRWDCPELGGHVPPATFVPLLEEVGLIRSIGDWVLHQACAEVRRWQTHAERQLFVAVNISALQLTTALPQSVARAIAEHGIAPAQLEIELTESAIMRDAEHGVRILHDLEALGVRLSVDDFGTGHSSLSYLKRLPIHTLKIDRSFVLDIPGDNEAVSIARAILALGHSLHLDIIGEGVETPEQAGFLCHNGCDLLQGYYFSRPVAAADFLAILTEKREFTLPAGGPRTLHLLSGKRVRG